MYLLKQQDYLVCLEKRNNRFILSKNEIDITESINDFTKYLSLVIHKLQLIEAKYEALNRLITPSGMIYGYGSYSWSLKEQVRIAEQNKIYYQNTKLFQLLESYNDLYLQITSNEDDFEIKFTHPDLLDYEELKQLSFYQIAIKIEVNNYCIESTKKQEQTSKELDYIKNNLQKDGIKINTNHVVLHFDDNDYDTDLDCEHYLDRRGVISDCIDLSQIQANHFFLYNDISYESLRGDDSLNKLNLTFKVNSKSIGRFLVMIKKQYDDRKLNFELDSHTYYETLNLNASNDNDDEYECSGCYLLSCNENFTQIGQFFIIIIIIALLFLFSNLNKNLINFKILDENEIYFHELTLLKLAVIKNKNILKDFLFNTQMLFVDLLID